MKEIRCKCCHKIIAKESLNQGAGTIELKCPKCGTYQIVKK